MNTLTEQSVDWHLAAPARARAALEYARSFTERFRDLAGCPPALREATLLELQMPAAFQPVLEGDAFAGRIVFPIAGVSPEPGGLGIYFSFDFVRRWGAHTACTEKEAACCRDLTEFWEAHATARKVRAAFPPDVAGLLPSDNWSEESGVAFPLFRIAGTFLDYSDLLRLGLDELEDERGHCFDGGARRWIGLLRSVIDRYTASVTDDAMRAVLAAVRHAPPSTFREAVQLLWLYELQAGSWSCGRLDDILGPYLVRDLDSGTLTEEDAIDLLSSFWRLIAAYENRFNNRVIVGGRGRSSEAAADRFALLAIETTRRMKLAQPQLTLRFYSGQNPLLWERAIDAIGEGCTYPMLYNDDVNVSAVAAAFDVDECAAESYLPFGCGEYVLGSAGIGSPNGVINLLKALEVALHGGIDPLTQRRVCDSPDPVRFTHFEDVWNAYARIVEMHIDVLARQQRIGYDMVARDTALIGASLLLADCAQRDRPALAGGIRYLGGTLETYGNTNTADSLHAIDELVFRRRELMLPDLLRALDANFEGYGQILEKCRAAAKYGNDEGTADAMAIRVHEHVCHATRNAAPRAGLDSFLVVIINNWANTLMGRVTGASAEGRLASQPLANGNNPAPGADTAGATAFLNSLVKLDPAIHAGAVQNMKFGREWFTPRLRPKFDALMRAYFKQGGTQAMITVVSRADLESALGEPEKWGHLMVRVGGFSIRFVDLPREAQLEVLARTLH